MVNAPPIIGFPLKEEKALCEKEQIFSFSPTKVCEFNQTQDILVKGQCNITNDLSRKKKQGFSQTGNGFHEESINS